MQTIRNWLKQLDSWWTRRQLGHWLDVAKHGKTVPVYELIGPVFFEEALRPATYVDINHNLQRTKISWRGLPNDSMAPANPIAKEIHRLWLKSIGGRTRKVGFGRSKSPVEPNELRRRALYTYDKPVVCPDCGHEVAVRR